MKDQQFDQQVKILKLHHRDIQEGIKKLYSLASSTRKTEADNEASQVSTLTKELFKYCEQLLHTSFNQSKKCDNLKQRLMKQLTESKLSKEQFKKYQQKLASMERKMEMMSKEKRDLEAVNAHLREQIKLAGFITSFTFKDESIHKGKPPKLQKSEINSISESEVQENSVCSITSQEDMQLYVSALDQLENNQNAKLETELEEVQQQFLKEVEELAKNSPQDSDPKPVESNE